MNSVREVLILMQALVWATLQDHYNDETFTATTIEKLPAQYTFDLENIPENSLLSISFSMKLEVFASLVEV